MNSNLMKIYRRLIMAAISLDIALLMLALSFNLTVFNFNFFTKQYEANKVYALFGKPQVDYETLRIYDYLQGRGEMDPSFFDQKEIGHMKDVRYLFEVGRVVFLALFILLVMLIYFYHRHEKLSIKKLFKISLGQTAFVIAITFLAALFNNKFEPAFIKFHEIFFTNQNWMLDQEVDKMIIMFPEEFFYNITRQIFIYWIAGSLLLLFIASLLLITGRIKKPAHP